MAEPPAALSDSDRVVSDIDPELVRLKKKVPVGPLLAVSVLGFVALVGWRFRSDVVYAGRGDTPVDAGSARTPRNLVENGFATLTGRPDATAPMRVRGAQETGRRLAPFVGTGGLVWLEDSGDALQGTLGFDDRFTGRVRRIADTPLAPELARYLADAPPVPHVVFRDGLGSKLPTVDASGDAIAIGPDTRVAVKLVVPDRARVVFVKTDDVADENAAREVLAKLGYSGGTPVETADNAWTFELVASPEAVNAALKRSRHFGAAATPAEETIEGRAADLDLAAPDTLELGDRTAARAAVEEVFFWVKTTVPADAWMLSAGDMPAGLWYMRPLYAVLALVAIFMLWALVVDVREYRHLRRKPQPLV